MEIRLKSMCDECLCAPGVVAKCIAATRIEEAEEAKGRQVRAGKVVCWGMRIAADPINPEESCGATVLREPQGLSPEAAEQVRQIFAPAHEISTHQQ